MRCNLPLLYVLREIRFSTDKSWDINNSTSVKFELSVLELSKVFDPLFDDLGVVCSFFEDLMEVRT